MTRPAAPVNYLLREVDADVWSRFKARAKAADLAMRDVLIDLVAAYADGALQLGRRSVKRVAPKGGDA